eukprot:TRINITY_DN7088_c0_g1_i1.p1 TRINITY_DN7088_c0_g1~~TRINITY_DN7088_c0_g1_i1.p1  ORF type:complete len:104 (-),score=11.94 TRINITY_DN7088_c0_g1_i1:162-473(-)
MMGSTVTSQFLSFFLFSFFFLLLFRRTPLLLLCSNPLLPFPPLQGKKDEKKEEKKEKEKKTEETNKIPARGQPKAAFILYFFSSQNVCLFIDKRKCREVGWES